MNKPGLFISNGDIYFLYNEHKNNFPDRRSQLWTVLNNNRAGETAVVLSKVDNNALDNHVLYVAKNNPGLRQPIYNNDFEYFYKILATDDNTVYYILKHDKEFRLEKLTW